MKKSNNLVTEIKIILNSKLRFSTTWLLVEVLLRKLQQYQSEISIVLYKFILKNSLSNSHFLANLEV